MMGIAVIGWGSLIWCPGGLRIKTKWRSDGPALPIEYVRISRDGRLSLVIIEGSEDQPVYWALSEFESLGDACNNLKERERTASSNIHWFTAKGRTAAHIPDIVIERVRDWLAVRNEISAAIWTRLTTNWQKKRRRDFTPEDAVLYLNELESERDRAAVIYDRAQEYIKKYAVAHTDKGSAGNARRRMEGHRAPQSSIRELGSVPLRFSLVWAGVATHVVASQIKS